MKKIVVTGGAGFIGSKLVRFLLKQLPGYKIVVIDNLSTGKIDNLLEVMGQVELEKQDICELPRLGKLIYGAEVLFHLAALPSVTQSVADPVLTGNVNLTGTLNVLEASRKHKVGKVVFSSSCAVYGDGSQAHKESCPGIPLSPYALQKRSSEEYCQLFSRLYHLPTVCLRYFNVYGPGQDPKSEYAAAVPKFITLAKEGEPLTIYGDGKATRDFVYIGDVVKANLLAFQKNGADGQIINIASGKTCSVLELAQTVISAAGSSSEIKFTKPRTGDILHSSADISLAKKLLDFSPEYDLEKGISRTVELMQ